MKQLGKELVVSIPFALIVKRLNEQVSSLQSVQDRLGSGTGDWGPVGAIPSPCSPACGPYHRIAQWGGQAFQHGRLQQEFLYRFGLLAEHLFHQVVQDESIAPREGADEAGNVIAPLHRDGRHLQPGDPTLRAGLQSGEIIRVEPQAHHIIHQDRNFIGPETQLVDADLGQLAARAQAGHRPGWIGTTGNNQMHLRRLVLQQEEERLMDLRVGNQVIIIQHQREGKRYGRQLVYQTRNQALDGGRLR